MSRCRCSPRSPRRPAGQNYDGNSADTATTSPCWRSRSSSRCGPGRSLTRALAVARRQARPRGGSVGRPADQGRRRRPISTACSPTRSKAPTVGAMLSIEGLHDLEGKARQSRPAPRRGLPHGGPDAFLRQRARRLDARREEGRADRRSGGEIVRRMEAIGHDRRHRALQPRVRRRRARDGAPPGGLQPRRRAGDLQGQPQPDRRRDSRRRADRRRGRRSAIGTARSAAPRRARSPRR